MNSYLQEELIQIGSPSKSKKEILAEIAKKAAKSPLAKKLAEKEILQALEKREEVTSTGLSQGIAIPHCSFDTIDQFIVGLIIIKDGIDFDSMDGNPAKLIFYIIGPKQDRNTHIKILSGISRLGKDPKQIKSILSADSPSEVLSLLSTSMSIGLKEGEEIDTTGKTSLAARTEATEKCQFVIHVQEEGLFNEVLEILSSVVDGRVSVLDAATAGTYLNKIPLFASFWTETGKRFSKIIISIIDKVLMNDVLRRINIVRPEDGGLILVSVQDLLYVDGSIDF